MKYTRPRRHSASEQTGVGRRRTGLSSVRVPRSLGLHGRASVHVDLALASPEARAMKCSLREEAGGELPSDPPVKGLFV